MLMAQLITARIRIFQRVIGWPLILKRTKSGMLIPVTGKYPKNQRIIRIMIIAINIF